MTPDEIPALIPCPDCSTDLQIHPADVCLDRQLARYVVGWTFQAPRHGRCCTCQRCGRAKDLCDGEQTCYISSDIGAAFHLMRLMQLRGYSFALWTTPLFSSFASPQAVFRQGVVPPVWGASRPHQYAAFGHGTQPGDDAEALAIGRAALLAMLSWDIENNR